MKNYLIIGGSSGIGKAIVHELSEQGHQVYATYHTTAVDSKPGRVEYFHLDVTADLPDMTFLPDKLNGVVYCPGSINLLPFLRINPKAFVDDFNLQVTGAIKVLQKVIPLLKKEDVASVVLFSTVAVQTGFNFHSQVSASKGAIEGLTRSLAAEFAPKIRVNAIAPSITHTPLAAKFINSEEKLKANENRHPLKTIGKPEDIANLTKFLLSDQSNWITGQILTIDGGISSLRV